MIEQERRLPPLARTGPPAMSAVGSLTDVNRTWPGQRNSVEKDPNQTWVDDGRMSAVGAKVITPLRVASGRKAKSEQHGSARIRWTVPLRGSPACDAGA